jgi:hypothetical protein
MGFVTLIKISKVPLLKTTLVASAFIFAFSPLFIGVNQVEAAVAYDAVSHDSAAAAGATSSFNWTHTPVGTPRGVLVYVVQGTTAVDEVTSVTYGSLTLTRVGVACDTLTEPGCVYAYFGGYSVPTGAQTVTVNSSGASGKHASAVTYTAGADTQVTNLTTLVENLVNPSKSLALLGKTSHVSIGIYSGLGAVANITPSSGWTSRYEDDFGNFLSGFYTYDTVNSSDVTTGYTGAVDDVAFLAVAVSEVDPLNSPAVFRSPGDQKFIVPAGVHSITVKAWGAGGGGGGGGNVAGSLGGGAGGAGGFAQSTIPVTPGETIDLTVGVGGPGGEPGGANSTGTGGAGGGRTEVRRSSTSLLIAPGGGGGGGGDDAITTIGGAGGAGGNRTAGGNGFDASANNSEANGATNTAGGTGGAGTFNTATAGGLKTAGDGADGLANTADGSSNNALAADDGDGGVLGGTNAGGGGGGGGYYGGGGGGSDTSHGGDGGGGGVSYFDSTVSATTSTAGSGVTPGNTADGNFNSSHAGGGAGGGNAAYGTDGEHGLMVISYNATAALTGTVYEDDGATPLAATTTTVTATFGGLGYTVSTTTDSSGNYSFSFSQTNPATTWTARSAAGNNDGWYGVAYGNNRYVAVGPGTDRVMTSPDGVTWTVQSAAGDDDSWQDIVYGNGLFVAVGDVDDRVMTSPDGVTWTAQTSPDPDDQWYGVAYGNGLFVAVGSSGPNIVMTSPDGVTWTARSAVGNNDNWSSITYGEGLFVAVGDTNDVVMTSPDGITWTARIAADDDDLWKSVTYGEGTFVAVGDTVAGDKVMTSPDGITWTARSAAGDDDNWNAVTYGNGIFVATGYSGGDSVMTSPDGITWTARTAVENDDYWQDIVYANGLFVAVGDSGDDVVMTSLGGVSDISSPITLYTEDSLTTVLGALSSWTPHTAVDDNDSWKDATYGEGIFVAVGDSGDRVMTSPDGITWTARSAADDDDEWNGVTYGEGIFVAVGDSGDRVMTSPDGITWATTTAAGNDDGWNSVTYGEGIFVAVGDSGDRVMTSPDGITWTARSAVGNDDQWADVTHAEDIFVAVGITGDRVMTSPDGVTWTARSINTTNPNYWNSITYGNDIFLAVGSCSIFDDEPVTGCSLTSTDGISWNADFAATYNDNEWSSVVYANRKFVAVSSGGDDEYVMTSNGGGSWTGVSAAGNNDSWNGIAYGNGTLVAVGDSGDRVMSSSFSVEEGPELKANTLTYLDTSTTTSTGVDLHQNTVRIHHAGDGTIDTTTAGFSDYTFDSDILFTIDGATTSIGFADASSNLSIATSTTFIIPDTLRVRGDFINSGILNSAGSTVYLEGPESAVSGSFVGANALNHVVVDPTTGAANWTRQQEDLYLNDIVFAENIFVGVGTCGGSYEGGPISNCVQTSTDGITWTPRNAGNNRGNFGSIVYGEDTFVAVGSCYDSNEEIELDCIITSSNGTTWATTSSPNGIEDSWGDITYGNGMFLAIGYDQNDGNGSSTIMTSPDGINWTSDLLMNDYGDWYEVTYGNGTFVAIGYDVDYENYTQISISATSLDGITWATSTIPLINEIADITYGEDLFVIVSRDGNEPVAVSSDGINWTLPTPHADSDDYWAGVTYANGMFVAVGKSDAQPIQGWGMDHSIMYSPDGITWTTSDYELGWWDAVAYGNGKFVVVGSGVATTEPKTNFASASTSNLTVAATKDLTTTNRLSVSGNFLNNGDFNSSNVLYLTGTNKTLTTAEPTIGEVVVIGSIDFLSNATTSNLTVKSGGSFEPHNLLTIQGNYIQDGTVDLSGTDIYIERSGTISGNMTGSNAFGDLIIDPGSVGPWESTNTPSNSWNDIIYAEGIYVAVASDNQENTERVVTSTDGVTWTPRSAVGDDDGWRSLAHGNGMFVAVGTSQDGNADPVMSSPDGINWTARVVPDDYGGYWNGVAYGNGLFVAVGFCSYSPYTYASCSISSPDGVTWTSTSTPSSWWYDITFGGGKFVAVGGSGFSDYPIMYSTDGMNWASTTSPNGIDDTWATVTYGDGLYVAAGGNNFEGTSTVLITSPDGITWTERPTIGIDGYWQGLTYGDGEFMAVGDCSASNCSMSSPDGINWTAYQILGDDNDWYGITYNGDTYYVAGHGNIARFARATTTAISNIEAENLTITSPSMFSSETEVLVNSDYKNYGAYENTSTTTVNFDFLNRGIFNNQGILHMTGSVENLDSSSPEIGNLTISGSTILLQNATTSNLRVNSGGTLQAEGKLTVNENFTNNGTLTLASSTVYLEGVDPTITGSFVGVNTLDTVVINPRVGGATWTARSAAGNDDFWTSVAYGNGIFVAVGDNIVMTSPDGITWTVQSAAGNNDFLTAVTYARGLFVAVSSFGDRVITSPDGITWTAHSAAGDDDGWGGIIF